MKENAEIWVTKSTTIHLANHVSQVVFQGLSLERYNGNEQDITIPDVEEINIGALQAKHINNVTLPKTLLFIENSAFSNNNLTSIQIPSATIKISENAFSYNKLIDIELPSSIEYLSGFNNNNLTSIAIPENVEVIGNKAFSDNKLTSITIPNNVELIRDQAFSNNSLSSIVIPDSVKYIYDQAFYNNPLKKIILHDTIRIKSDAFPSGVQEIYIHNTANRVPELLKSLHNYTSVLDTCSKIVIFGRQITFFEERKIAKISQELLDRIIVDPYFKPQEITNRESSEPNEPSEISNLISKIDKINACLTPEERTVIKDYVNHFLTEYYENLDTLDNSLTLTKEPISLSLESTTPKDLKTKLLTNLEAIIHKLNANTKYQSLLSKILDYESYLNEKELNETDTTSDEIKFIIMVAHKYENTYLLNSIRELLNNTKKEISSYIITTFNSEIKLSLTKDIEQEFHNKARELYNKCVRFINIKQYFAGETSDEISRLFKLISEIIMELDPYHQELYQREFSIIKTKYEDQLLNNPELCQTQVEDELNAELKPLITSLNKYVHQFTTFKLTINEINNGRKSLDASLPNLGLISSLIDEIKELTTNVSIPHHLKSEVTDQITNLLTIWQENVASSNTTELTNYLHTLNSFPNQEKRHVLSDLNLEVLILIAKELYSLKTSLEEIIRMKEEINIARKR